MTIFDYIEKYAKEREHSVAIKYGSRCLSYRELYYYLANLQQLDHRFYNSIVLLKSDTTINFLLAFLYLLSENCKVIPVSNGIKESELEDILSGISYMNYDCSIIPSKLLQKRAKLKKPSGEKAGIYHATSGSTGKSKLCIRTLDNLTAEGLAYKECLKITYSDKIASLCPLYHSYAMGAALMGALVSGATLYVMEGISLRKSIRTIIKENISVVIIVPAIAKLMCEVNQKEKQALSSVRIILSGAGVIDYELFDDFYKKFGVYLQNNYGSTETGGLLTRLSADTFPSLGKPMQGVKIKICKDNTFDDYGELYVKSNGMFQGYVNQEKSVFDSEGFYATGDYVSKDLAGNLFYKGRKNRIINIGGKKINPEEVEKVICKFPGVMECAVIAGHRRNNNTISVAFVVIRYDDLEGLYSHCTKYLSKYKIPSAFYSIKKLPRNKMGKVKIDELKKMLENI